MTSRNNDNPRAAGPVDKSIGERIRARRLELGMSQEALGAALGITFQQIQKYEKGVNRVAAATLVEIARALRLPIAAFLPSDNPATTDGAVETLIADLTALLTDLSPGGRRVLRDIARILAQEPALASVQDNPGE